MLASIRGSGLPALVSKVTNHEQAPADDWFTDKAVTVTVPMFGSCSKAA